MSKRSGERPPREKSSSERAPNDSPEDSDSPENEREESSRPPFSSLVFLVMIALVLALAWQWVKSPTNHGTTVSYDFFWNQLSAHQNVSWVKFNGEVLTGEWKVAPPAPERKEAGEAKKGLTKEFNLVLPLADDKRLLEQLLLNNDVEIKAALQAPGFAANLAMWVFGFGPMIFLAWMLWSTVRRSSDPMGSGMFGSFIRSPAQRFKPSDQQTTFADVAAMESAKGELAEIVDFLKNPAKYQRLGAHIPKGVLLVGPPGTGKTLLARATAGEAGVPFYSINGSEFIQMFVGVGASRVRDLFRNAKENSPCLVFIDEIDAVGRVRGAGLGGGHDEREQTLNQILSEMDGFQQTEAVIVIAATNRPDVLDAALLRPGRFDRNVTVDRPTRQGREEILQVHSRKVPLADDVSLADVASGTIGFSGAELMNLVNEAALSAARAGRDRVTADDFDFARDKILMGPTRKEVLSPREREITAYHEAGHALVAWYLPEMDPVHKVTIIPRGRALGVTQLLPDEERYNVGERRLHSMLAFALGGRAAEKLIYNEYSAGAEDDLKRSTQTARRMVSRWGMSEAIGPVAFHTSEEQPFLGKEMSHEHREFSEETARLIDREIQRVMQEAAKVAQEMLVKHRAQLDALTQMLLTKESIGKEEMTECLGPLPPRADSVSVVPPTTP